MSGKGPGSGFDFQSRLNAYVAVHILAREPLRWTPLATNDIPVSLRAEGGGSGDDLRIELEQSDAVYECQAKRGLSADGRLDAAVDEFAEGLPLHAEERGLLLVDASSAGTIRHQLRDGLDAWRQGTNPKETGALKRVLDRLRTSDAPGAAARIYVVEMDVERDVSPHALHSIDVLSRILDDPDQAGAAWAALVTDGLTLCREGGRRTFQDLVATLGKDNIALNGGVRGARRQLEQVAQVANSTHANTEQLLAMMARVIMPPQPSAGNADSFSAQLNWARDLLNTGDASASLALLRSIREAVATASMTTVLRHRNLTAAALLHLERLDDARIELNAVLTFDPADRTATLNLAQLEWMQGHVSEALAYADAAIARDPGEVSAWAIVVQCRPDALIPESVRGTAPILTALAVVEMRRAAWSTAVALLRDALNSDGFDPERAALLAHCIYGEAFESGVAETHASQLDEADTLLDRVLDADPQRHNTAIAELALLGKGQIARFRGDALRAGLLFDEARHLRPHSTKATYLLALSWLDQDQPAKALYVLDTVPAPATTAQLESLRARALLESGDESKARNAFAHSVQLNQGPDADYELAVALVETAIDARWTDEAERLLDQLPSRGLWIEDLMSARIAVQRGRQEDAESAFIRAIDRGIEPAVPQLRAEFAEFLRKGGRPKEAVAQLEAAGAGSTPTLQPLYARALHEAQEFSKAAALLEHVKAEARELPAWALTLGTAIATLSDDVPAAIEYLSLMVKRSPDNYEAALRLCLAHLRNRTPENAITVLESLVAHSDLAARQLIRAAELFIRAGAPERALPLAFRALRMEPDAADIQVAYVNLFLQRDRDLPVAAPTVVAEDTAVTLRTDDGATHTYYIVGAGKTDARLGELSPQHTLAQELLGKVVGDRIILRAGTLSQAVAEVTEIKSGFVHAFQDILQHFPSRHPNNATLQSFHVPDEPTPEDFNFLLTQLKQDEESEQELLRLYDQHALPLGMVGQLLGRGVAEAYAAVVGRPDNPMLVEFGDALGRARDAAASDTVAILTRSALITAQQLDILDLITRAHPALVVPQSLLDELQEERYRWTHHASDGYRGALYRNGQFGMLVHSPENVRAGIEELDRIVAWIVAHCEVRPRPIEFLGCQEDEDLREKLGASSSDSIVLARALNGELYADDLGLRRVAAAQTGRIGFSTFTLLAAALRAGAVAPRGFDRHVGTLLRLNHASIPMRPQVLATALVEHGFRLDPPVVTLVNRLRTASGTHADLAVYCAEVLREVAVSPAGISHLAALTVALTEAVAARYGPRDTTALLRRAASQRLQLLPDADDAVQAALNRYEAYIANGKALIAWTPNEHRGA